MIYASVQNSWYISITSCSVMPLGEDRYSLIATARPFHWPIMTFPNAPWPKWRSTVMSRSSMLLNEVKVRSGARRLICTRRDGFWMLLQYTKGVPSWISATMASMLNSHGSLATFRLMQCTHGIMRAQLRLSSSDPSTSSNRSTVCTNKRVRRLSFCASLQMISISFFLLFEVTSSRSLPHEAIKPSRHMLCSVILSHRSMLVWKICMSSGR
mmetsp:Transcript_23257/g.58167  ORF Transcript_23257/g.58167 Transcript_23257/m.58167 type:complete len:212 (+) Transcript_23257:569-1204(+)